MAGINPAQAAMSRKKNDSHVRTENSTDNPHLDVFTARSAARE